jgi:hypothetical protein
MSFTASSAIIENVVSAPQNPMPNNAHMTDASCFTKTPIIKLPAPLISMMLPRGPNGNAKDSRYRHTVPANPPMATNANAISMNSQLNGLFGAFS